MAKRYIDTGFYKSPFVRGLKGSLKSLYCFIICDCDGAGIWCKDLSIASAYIGFTITEQDFNTFVKAGKAIDLNNGKFFFPDFIEHQYPKGLSITNPAQTNFILELQKYNLVDSDLQVIKTLQSPSEGPSKGSMVKVKVMEEVKVTVNEDHEKSKLELKLEEFYSFRKQLKKPIIEASKAALVKNLNKMSNNNESIAIAIIDQSIAFGWQGLFPLKNEIAKNKKEEYETVMVYLPDGSARTERVLKQS